MVGGAVVGAVGVVTGVGAALDEPADTGVPEYATDWPPVPLGLVGEGTVAGALVVVVPAASWARAARICALSCAAFAASAGEAGAVVGVGTAALEAAIPWAAHVTATAVMPAAAAATARAGPMDVERFVVFLVILVLPLIGRGAVVV